MLESDAIIQYLYNEYGDGKVSCKIVQLTGCGVTRVRRPAACGSASLKWAGPLPY